MKFKKTYLTADFGFKLLFHLIFWFFWMILPLINAHFDGDTRRYHFMRNLLPMSFVYVPFFYFNSNYLIKKFIPKAQVTSYIVSLLLLFFVFLFATYVFKDFLIDDHPIRIYDARTLFPVLFIISMSTVYGFIVFMIDQNRKNQEENEEKLKSELSFLRSQISPHFIFNVLNSIVYLIRTDAKKAENVTIELSELIRYMLYDSEHKQVVLEKELSYLRNYVELQTIRFGEDVAIDLNVEGNSVHKYIEPMLLIPFVENAFKHGVGYVKDPFISINANCNAQDFEFIVKNKISSIADENKDFNSGIGLKNVKRRLELLYPDKHSLNIETENDIFTIYLKLEYKAGTI